MIQSRMQQLGNLPRDRSRGSALSHQIAPTVPHRRGRTCACFYRAYRQWKGIRTVARCDRGTRDQRQDRQQRDQAGSQRGPRARKWDSARRRGAGRVDQRADVGCPIQTADAGRRRKGFDVCQRGSGYGKPPPRRKEMTCLPSRRDGLTADLAAHLPRGVPSRRLR